MKAMTIWSTFLLVGIGVGGCAPVIPPGFKPVTDPFKRYELVGFSVLPPHGRDWLIIPPSLTSEFGPNAIAFGRLPKKSRQKGPPPTVGASAMGFLVDIPFSNNEELLDNILKEQEKSSQGERYKLVSIKGSPDKISNSDCRRYDIIVEDRGVPQFKGFLFNFHREGFFCLHPHFPRFVVLVEQSLRKMDGMEPIDVRNEVEPFVQSLQFSPLPFETKIPVTFIPVEKNPKGLTTGNGSVWVSQFSGNSLSRIDAGTGRIVAVIPVGHSPIGVTFAHGAVWVVNQEDGSVSRVDPETNLVTATIQVGRKPFLVAAGEGSVWITNYEGGTVSRIDPATNTVTATIAVGKNPIGIAVGEGIVWVANYQANTVTQIDPRTNRVIGMTQVGKRPGMIAIGGGGVWVPNAESKTVTRIDLKTRQVVTTIGVGKEPSSIAATADAVWVTNTDDDTISLIDPRTNLTVGKPIPVGSFPLSLAIGEGGVWVGNTRSGTVARIDPGVVVEVAEKVH